MMPQTLALSSTPELVRAYETLRAAILSSGAGATLPVHAWRLVHEGLLAWGLWAGAARETPGARGGARDIAADGPGVCAAVDAAPGVCPWRKHGAAVWTHRHRPRLGLA